MLMLIFFQQKVCWGRCQLDGCLHFTLADRILLFEEYWSMGDYSCQRTFLLGLVDSTAPVNGQQQYRYIKE